MNMENYLPKGMGKISVEEISRNLEMKSSENEKVVQAHVIDNPKNIADVKKIKEGYINFLYNHYPQLRKLSREEISSFTRKDLHYILHPEIEKQIEELQRYGRILQKQEKIITNFYQASRNLNMSLWKFIWKSFWKNY